MPTKTRQTQLEAATWTWGTHHMHKWKYQIWVTHVIRVCHINSNTNQWEGAMCPRLCQHNNVHALAYFFFHHGEINKSCLISFPLINDWDLSSRHLLGVLLELDPSSLWMGTSKGWSQFSFGPLLRETDQWSISHDNLPMKYCQIQQVVSTWTCGTHKRFPRSISNLGDMSCLLSTLTST